MRTISTLALVAAMALGAAACSENAPTARLHEPGKYLGARDPLLDKAKSAALEETHAKRFALVQTDR